MEGKGEFIGKGGCLAEVVGEKKAGISPASTEHKGLTLVCREAPCMATSLCRESPGGIMVTATMYQWVYWVWELEALESFPHTAGSLTWTVPKVLHLASLSWESFLATLNMGVTSCLTAIRSVLIQTVSAAYCLVRQMSLLSSPLYRRLLTCPATSA